MNPLFPESSFVQKSIAAGIGIFSVAILFLIIPLIQMVVVEKEPVVLLESMFTMPESESVNLPVSASPPAAEERTPPILRESEPVLKISLMDLNLEPSLQCDTSSAFNDDVLQKLMKDAGDYRRILNFEDLQHAPTIVYLPEIHFPEALVRQHIREGQVIVTVIIDEEGRAQCERVESASHPLLEELVRNVVRKTRFSVSVVNGTPVKVRGTWPLNLQAPG